MVLKPKLAETCTPELGAPDRTLIQVNGAAVMLVLVLGVDPTFPPCTARLDLASKEAPALTPCLPKRISKRGWLSNQLY